MGTTIVVIGGLMVGAAFGYILCAVLSADKEDRGCKR